MNRLAAGEILPTSVLLRRCRDDWLAGELTASESRRRPGNVGDFAFREIYLEFPVTIEAENNAQILLQKNKYELFSLLLPADDAIDQRHSNIQSFVQQNDVGDKILFDFAAFPQPETFRLIQTGATHRFGKRQTGQMDQTLQSVMIAQSASGDLAGGQSGAAILHDHRQSAQ